MDASHLSALQLKHAGLERQIQEEMTRPMPDISVLQTLKKRKLRLCSGWKWMSPNPPSGSPGSRDS